MRLLESQNLYPDCISLALETVATSTAQFDLYVTLNFSQQWQSLLQGQIKFGLKGGKLSLKLDNGALASQDTHFDQVFTVIPQVSQNHPSWTFTLKTSQWVFNGSLTQVKLGTITIDRQPCYVNAYFAICPSDISLTDADGLWRHDIRPNKHGVLERKLALYFWKNQFTPYLSWIQLGSEDAQMWQEGAHKVRDQVTQEDLSQLQKIIDEVYGAKTNDFRQLAELAGLNLLHDFAGGNLLAAELSGIELSGANLYHANLRGSNLTDADLSEANLNHAKLSGCDFSGAYLGNANLSYSDLHNSSLALANLIGADLRGANLTKVNLSQANLSGAKVQGAIFGENTGISAQTKQYLREHGAIIN